MPLAMLLTVVGVLISAVLASIVTVQTGTTRRAVQGLHALDAAQAGLDVAVGHIRAATDVDADGNSDLGSLPCGTLPTSPVGVGGDATYAVTIAYRNRAGTAIPCAPGGGVAETPSYADLRSTGRDLVAGVSRTLEAVYTFSTTNANIPGGQIHVHQTPTSQDLCLSVDSSSPTPVQPASGDPLVVRECSIGGWRQTFAYNPNLTITLVSSITTSNVLGMCLDAGAHAASPSSAPVRFQPCGTTTQPRQQWSFNDTSNIEGTSNGRTLDGHCFNVQVPDQPGSAVLLVAGGGACYGSGSNQQNFSPDKQVGAGAAGAASKQLVNFEQFGRCLDVPAQNWRSSYLAAWPCKQSPDGSQLLWNQVWDLPDAGTDGVISTDPSYETFSTCLQSPLTTGASSYVSLDECEAGPPADMTWTVYGDTGTYATSYTIVDDAGNCLTAADPDAVPADLHPGGYRVSKVKMLPCTGITRQKWNAPPEVVKGSPLKDIVEK